MKETIINLRKVFKIADENRKYFIVILITSVIQMIVGIILPLYTAKQIVLFTDNVYEQLILSSIMVLIINLINELNTFIMALVCRKFRTGTIKNLQIMLGSEILKIRERDIQKHGTGTFIERLTGDTDKMADMFTHGTGYISKTLMNAGIFIAVFIINKVVFLFYFFVALILTWLYLIRTDKMGKLDIISRMQGDKVSSLVGELVKGEKDLKMLFAKKIFLNKLQEEIIDRNNKEYKKRVADVLYVLIIKVLSSIFSFLLVILLIYLIKNNVLTAALAVALFTYKTNIMANFMENTSLLLDELKSFNISTNRVFDVMNNKNFHQEKFGKMHLEKIEGNFEFRNVSFAYDEYKVINNMSFKINSEEVVAFVGKSGAGKSTIFNLIGKLYDIKDGSIFIDGINLNELDEESIRSNITLISQNPYIFNMSIRDNFKLVKGNITDEEIRNVLELTCLYDFVKKLPNGLDTIINEGGANLSGGQRQRLAIARALVQETKIILFDEATSALDNETQKDIQAAVNNLKGKYTILMIAHRLSTIKNADRILFVSDGRILMEGTHDELMNSCEEYKKLYEAESMKV